MANKKPLPTELEALFRAKQKRRKELANLPFEEKISILLELQNISHDLRSAKSRDKHLIWDISA
ncbi:MAG: hypothetical protein ONB46_23280 [candidate division KSB1 bacterium]|nr:hypothetical protein [candidate division KSB1 bacterium]MDZ7368779.1 hypothetical protein [candidate division KSB1 bacterium]MDZ7406589.1 hypothetical protein [candidate division KSB1 bacterium]